MAIEHTVWQKLFRRTQSDRDRADKDQADCRQKKTADDRDIDNHGKVTPGILGLSFTQCLGYDSTSTASHHEAQSTHSHNERPYKI